MSSSVPSPISPKTSSQANETAIATSIYDLNRYFQPKIMKVSKQSPPVLNVDVKEGEIIWDRTLKRIYTVSDGVLRFVAFT